jgi:hypothetical protein
VPTTFVVARNLDPVGPPFRFLGASPALVQAEGEAPPLI